MLYKGVIVEFKIDLECDNENNLLKLIQECLKEQFPKLNINTVSIKLKPKVR